LSVGKSVGKNATSAPPWMEVSRCPPGIRTCSGTLPVRCTMSFSNRPLEPESPWKTVRVRGALKLVAAGCLAVVAWLIVRALAMAGKAPHGEAAVLAALPGAWALVGLLELVTGVPFSQMSYAWSSLRGWQRGVLGCLVAIVAVFLMMGIFFWVFWDDVR
jgi:hypothetical protein